MVLLLRTAYALIALSLLASYAVAGKVEGEKAVQTVDLEASVAANIKSMGTYAELSSDVLSKIMVSEVGLRVEFTAELNKLMEIKCLSSLSSFQSSNRALHYALASTLAESKDTMLNDKSLSTSSFKTLLGSVGDEFSTKITEEVPPQCKEQMASALDKQETHHAFVGALNLLVKEGYTLLASVYGTSLASVSEETVKNEEEIITGVETVVYNVQDEVIPRMQYNMTALSLTIDELTNVRRIRSDDLRSLRNKAARLSGDLEAATVHLKEEAAVQDNALPLRSLATSVRDRVIALESLVKAKTDLESRLEDAKANVAQLKKQSNEQMDKLAVAADTLENENEKISRDETKHVVAAAASASFVANEVKGRLVDAEARLEALESKLNEVDTSISSIKKTLDASELEFKEKFVAQQRKYLNQEVADQVYKVQTALDDLYASAQNVFGRLPASPMKDLESDSLDPSLEEVVAVALHQASHAEERLDALNEQVEEMRDALQGAEVDIDRVTKQIGDLDAEIKLTKESLDQESHNLADTLSTLHNNRMILASRRPKLLVFQSIRDMEELSDSMSQLVPLSDGGFKSYGAALESSKDSVNNALNKAAPFSDVAANDIQFTADIVLRWAKNQDPSGELAAFHRLRELESTGKTFIDSLIKGKASLRHLMIKYTGGVPQPLFAPVNNMMQLSEGALSDMFNRKNHLRGLRSLVSHATGGEEYPELLQNFGHIGDNDVEADLYHEDPLKSVSAGTALLDRVESTLSEHNEDHGKLNEKLMGLIKSASGKSVDEKTEIGYDIQKVAKDKAEVESDIYEAQLAKQKLTQLVDDAKLWAEAHENALLEKKKHEEKLAELRAAMSAVKFIQLALKQQ